MVGWISQLRRLFKTDIDIDPDSGGNNDPLAVPYLADGEGSAGDPSDRWSRFQEFMVSESTRKKLYELYEKMDTTDIVAGVLDLYAEGATPVDPETDRTLWVETKNKKMKFEADNLFKELRLEEEIIAQARELARNGDIFERLVYQKGRGVLASHPVRPKFIHRREDKVHKLLGFMQDGKKFRKKSSNQSYPWDYLHFRLRGRNREGLYGTSICYNMIRPWRQLVLAEDHALVYQISRHPDRNLFLIDVGTNDELEAQKIVKAFKTATRANNMRNPSTGDYDHRFNPVTSFEDVYMGTRQNSATRVEKLPGSANASDVVNLNYYANKLFSAARVPKSAFGYEGRFEYNSKAMLTNQDIRFARNVRRLQRSIKQGYRTLLEIHYILRMDDPERDAVYDWRREGNDFTVKMTAVSWLEELERLELQQLRYQVVDMMIQSGRDHPSFNSRNWVAHILKTYMHFTSSKLNQLLTSQSKSTDREEMGFGTPDALGRQAAAQMRAQVDVEGAPQNEPQQKERKGESFKDWGIVDGNVSDEEADLVLHLISESPKLQGLLEKGRSLWLPEGNERYRSLPLDEEELSSSELSDDFEVDEVEDDL